GTASPGAWPRPQFSGVARHFAAQLCQSRAAEGADRRTDRGGRQMQWRALRHGDADAARDFPAHMGSDAGAVLAESDGGGAVQTPWLHFYGGGLLGPRMEIAAGGFRLLLRQTAL